MWRFSILKILPNSSLKSSSTLLSFFSVVYCLISFENFSGTIEKNRFASGLIIKKLEFNDFSNNVSIGK